jgi:hypothetical protein
MARGPIALIILVVIILAYCCEIAMGTATAETHQTVGGVLLFSAIATGIAIVWHVLTKKK